MKRSTVPQGSVAVLIPARDASRTIMKCVGSALVQPEACEIVVVDDGSTDDTAAIARSCDDGTGRLRVLQQANRGPSAAINRAQLETTAPYLCVLDADDFFLPGRLAFIFSGAGPGWDMAADRLLLAQEGLEEGPYERWKGEIPADGLLTFAQFVTGNITDPARPRTELGYLQPVIRRAFLDAHGLRHNEEVRLGEDYLLYANVLAHGGVFRVTGDFRYVAVSRPNSLSHAHRSEDLAALLSADRELGELVSCPSDRRAISQHITHIRNKLVLHLALEAKAGGNVIGALAQVIVKPGAWGFVLGQTLKSRLGRRRCPKLAQSGPSPVI